MSMKLCPTALVTAFAILSPSTSAQQPDNSHSGRTLEEVIVTATFRETRLIDTPISITALDGKMLQDKGIFNIEDLYTSLPSVAFNTNSNTYNRISIRGLSAPAFAGATVGIYVDDIPITDSFDGTSVSSNVGVDLARVEALKGPQGTLYGEGAVGGAIRYITNDADPTKWELNVNAGLESNKESNDLTNRTSVVLNVPLIEDKLAIRMAGNYSDTAGFLDVAAPRNEDDVDESKDKGGRIKINWIATDWLSLEASYHYNVSEFGGPGLSTFEFGTDELTDPALKNGGDDVNKLANITMQMEFADKVALTTSLSYFQRDIDYQEQIAPRFGNTIQMAANCGAAQLGLLQPPLGPSLFPGVDDFTFCIVAPSIGFPHPYPVDAVMTSVGGGDTFHRAEDRGVAEIRAMSINPDSRWQWIAGLYAKRSTGTVGRNSDSGVVYATRAGFEAVEPLINAFLFPLGYSEVKTDLDEVAAYGDLTYSLTDALDLTLGLRASRVTKEASDASGDVEDKKLSPKLSVAWRPEEGTLFYGTIQRGYRPGYFNQPLVAHNNNLRAILAAGPPYAGLASSFANPRADENGDGVVDNLDAEIHLAATDGFVQQDGDEVTSYELGWKTRFWDDRITLMSSIYYNDWKDTFVQIRDAPMLASAFGDLLYTTSGGGAHTQGFELDVVAQVTDRLTLTLGGDYIDEAELDEVPANAGGLFVDNFGNAIQVNEGARLPDSPEYSLNLGMAYTMDLPRSMTGTFAVDYYRIDKLFATVTNERVTPAYYKFDARFTAYTADLKWRFSLYGKNLTDELIIYDNGEAGIRFGRPRSIGLEVSYNIGS